MSLNYREGILHMEDVPLTELAAAVGTPTYAYSRQYLSEAVERLQTAFAATPTKIHYAVKANSNLSILRLMADLGCGFDIVSGGELVFHMGPTPNKEFGRSRSHRPGSQVH